MMYTLDYIKGFLSSHEWTEGGDEGGLFSKFYSPEGVAYPGYFLDIPKDDKHSSFQRYVDRLLPVVVDAYNGEFTEKDIATFFSSENTVLSFRLVDPDTQAGTILLSRLRKAYDLIEKTIKQATAFAVDAQPIFAEAKEEVRNYLNVCRGVPTMSGSFIVKFELPENHFDLFDNRSVPSTIVDTIDFLNKLTFNYEEADITEDFISENLNSINVELFEAIVQFYKTVRVQNVDVSLHSARKYNKEQIRDMRKRVSKMDSMVREIKGLLLKRVPLEAEGKIVRLQSKEIETSGTIVMEFEYGGEDSTLLVQLDSVSYQKAVTAHRLGRFVKVTGIATQYKNRFTIQDVDSFSVDEKS